MYLNNNEELFILEQQGKSNQIKLESGVRIPLDFSAGKWRRLLQSRARLSWQNVSNQSYEQSFLTLNNNGELARTGETNTIDIADVDYWGMEYSLYFHNKLRGNSRDVDTRWGQSANILFRHTPWGNYNAGYAFAISSQLNLPGLAKHHAISIGNNWQTKISGDETSSSAPYRTYQKFSDMLNLPRGYESIYNDDLYVFRGTYQMPLWNPDVSIAGMAYIKRFRLNVFFDAAYSSYELDIKETGEIFNFSDTFTSSGFEILSDFHAFRFVLPFSIGYRGGFRDIDNTFFHEAVFSTSFDNFLINNQK